jgi:hypothetical protein
LCRIVWDQMGEDERRTLALKSENDPVASLLSFWTED